MNLRIVFFWVTGFIYMLFPMLSNANEQNENGYLIQIINQLEAIKPLVIAAEREQPKNLRIKFHYRSYYDYTGKKFSGLFEDINDIEAGIKAKLSQPHSEPHRFIPLKLDYTNEQK